MKIEPSTLAKGNSMINGNASSGLSKKFQQIRKLTESLCEPLQPEDFVVQPVVEASPPKWHLAHTTWFFEELILKKYSNRYKVFNKQYSYLFNSYYESVGERVLRPERGNLSRPTVGEIMEYREHVNRGMGEFLEKEHLSGELQDLVTLGLNHEQQHQELLVTDLKYILGHNPLFPAYCKPQVRNKRDSTPGREWISIPEGVCEVGFNGQGFCFDNEMARHRVYLHPARIMDRLITNGEYMEFMESGGYGNFQWWLSEGWDWVQRLQIKAPLYWHRIEGKWMNYKLSGLTVVDPMEPVTHLSFFEADAFAQWKGLRLPTEFEWEAAASQSANPAESGTFLEDGVFHPVVREANSSQFLGDVWEWTSSAYLPYPYFSKAPGAVGEYNGKFMINQKVLRGGSCATPRDHIRLSYRNFFHPHLRWQFNGLRLAETIV